MTIDYNLKPFTVNHLSDYRVVGTLVVICLSVVNRKALTQMAVFPSTKRVKPMYTHVYFPDDGTCVDDGLCLLMMDCVMIDCV